jgi:hypothetical protein
LDVRERRITASVQFDVGRVLFDEERINDPLQCASDDFIITNTWGVMKAFAR